MSLMLCETSVAFAADPLACTVAAASLLCAMHTETLVYMQVAFVADVFAMSEEGPAGNFVNTHGYVHDMVTLRRAVHVDAVGKPEVENSWFKGCGNVAIRSWIDSIVSLAGETCSQSEVVGEAGMKVLRCVPAGTPGASPTARFAGCVLAAQCGPFMQAMHCHGFINHARPFSGHSPLITCGAGPLGLAVLQPALRHAARSLLRHQALSHTNTAAGIGERIGQ